MAVANAYMVIEKVLFFQRDIRTKVSLKHAIKSFRHQQS